MKSRHNFFNMDKNKLLIKLACLVGYLVFASVSAFFTASSLSLNLLNGTNLWFCFGLVLVVSILAGWCLTNVIEELNKPVRASRSSFVLNLIGFLIFWTFSFMTNVHYFFVEKHGYNILTKELASAKNYIIENTTKSNRAIDDQNEIAQKSLTEQVYTNIDAFKRELNNTMEHHEGFGEACINILNSTETILAKDSKTYNDKNTYIIFDEEKDAGDYGITQRNRFPDLYTKYKNCMVEQLNKKLKVIDDYYNRKKDENIGLTDFMKPIDDLETLHLPAVLKDGSVKAYYMYYDQQNGKVISKMPDDYYKKCIVKNKSNEIKSYKVYPSKRMFDTMSVWGDIVSGKLIGMTMLQWMVLSLIFDIVSFILFVLFRKN